MCVSASMLDLHLDLPFLFHPSLLSTGEKQYKFEEILPIYEHVNRQEDGTFADFLEGFKTFDREGLGYIPSAALRNALTFLGKAVVTVTVDMSLAMDTCHASHLQCHRCVAAIKNAEMRRIDLMYSCSPKYVLWP